MTFLQLYIADHSPIKYVHQVQYTLMSYLNHCDNIIITKLAKLLFQKILGGLHASQQPVIPNISDKGTAFPRSGGDATAVEDHLLPYREASGHQEHLPEDDYCCAARVG